MRKRKWRINAKKLYMGYRVVKLLGHLVGEGGLRADPEKLAAIK